MKVFFMQESSLTALEKSVNDFIKDKKVINISFDSNPATMVGGAVTGNHHVTALAYTVLIQYEDDSEHNPLAHPESYVGDAIAMIDDMTHAQRYEVYKHLEKRIEGNREFAECDWLSKRRIWVSQDVYERIVDNPRSGVIFEAIGKAPILVSFYKQ